MGAPLDRPCDAGTFPDWLDAWPRGRLAELPLYQVDARGLGVVGLIEQIDRMPVPPSCVVVLGARWLDPHQHHRLVLFDLKKLAVSRGLVVFAQLDIRFRARKPSPTSPCCWRRRASTPETEQFDVSLVGSLVRRAGVTQLVNRDRAMHIGELEVVGGEAPPRDSDETWRAGRPRACWPSGVHGHQTVSGRDVVQGPP